MIRKVNDLLVGNTYFYFIVVILIFEAIVVPLVVGELLVLITEDGMFWVPFFLGIKILGDLVDNLYLSNLIVTICYNLKKVYLREQFEKYNTLSFEDRTKKTAIEFNELLGKAQYSLSTVIEWGIPLVAKLVGTFVMILYTAIKKQMIYYIIGGVIALYPVYVFVISPKQNIFNDADMSFKKIRSRYVEKINISLIPFQYKEYTPEHLIAQKKIIYDGGMGIEKLWHTISGITKLSNSIFGLTICYLTSNNTTTFVLVMFLMEQLSDGVSNLTNFITQYHRISNDYDSMENFWKDCKFEDTTQKLQLSENNEIINFGVKLGAVDLKLDANFGKFVLSPKMKLLIFGPTGHGKSTLKKALFGLIDSDIVFEYGKPKNFHHLVADYFQEIKEKIPTSKTTLRDFFKDEPSNCTVEYYLKKAWSNRYNTIIESINQSNKKDKTELSSDDVHPYDLSINECMSGGEKSRLLLWSRGYEVDKNGKQIIILDEPCPDVDHDTYLNTLNDFFETYNNQMIFMIAHLCPCKIAGLKIEWDMKIKVENNIVSQVI